MNVAILNKSKTIIIIDSCGENRNARIFGINFDGWKTFNLYPNFDEKNIVGYLSWSLVNVLNREKPNKDSNYYLSPYIKLNTDESVELCKYSHKKRAILLGMYDHNFSKLTYNEIIKHAGNYKVYPCHFELS